MSVEVKSYAAVRGPDLRRAVILEKQGLIDLCKDFNLPVFRMSGVVFKKGIMGRKSNLNLLFTWFSGIWIAAYEDIEGGKKDGQENSGTPDPTWILRAP